MAFQVLVTITDSRFQIGQTVYLRATNQPFTVTKVHVAANLMISATELSASDITIFRYSGVGPNDETYNLLPEGDLLEAAEVKPEPPVVTLTPVIP